MTEAQWLECSDPQALLEFLRGKASDRKLRLFALACCRRVWNLLTDERSREAVALAEHYADRAATKKALLEARRKAKAAVEDHTIIADFSENWRAKQAAAEALGDNAFTAAQKVAWLYRKYPAKVTEYLRDVTGNPFRPPAPVDPALARANDSAVARLAQGIYDEGAFEGVAVLADALEDAGCDDADILTHCRTGVHVRGCWVVDLLLGKG